MKVSLALSPRVYMHKHTEHRRNEREQRERARQQQPLLALLSQIINTVYSYFKIRLSTAPLRGYRTHSNTSSLPKLIKKTDTAAEDPHFSVCAVIAEHRLVNNNRRERERERVSGGKEIKGFRGLEKRKENVSESLNGPCSNKSPRISKGCGISWTHFERRSCESSEHFTV